MKIVNENALSSIVAEIGELILSNKYGISVDIGNGQETIINGEVGNQTGDTTIIKIGNVIVQCGRVNHPNAPGTTFTVTYDEPLANSPSYASIGSAGNDYPTETRVQINGSGSKPSSTAFEATVTSGEALGNDYYYWMVIGRRADIQSA